MSTKCLTQDWCSASGQQMVMVLAILSLLLSLGACHRRDEIVFVSIKGIQ